MQNNSNWLIIAEYASIAGSIIGTAIAVANQQLLYAATPISLSLLLNLANRRALERLPRGGGEIVQVQRQMLAEIEYMRRNVAETASGEPVRIAISDLAQAISYLQSEMTVQARELRALQNNLQNLASQRLPSLAPVQAQLEELNSRLIKNQPVNYTSSSGGFNSNLESKIEELRISVLGVLDALAKQRQDSQTFEFREDLTRLFAEIEKLQSQQVILYQMLGSLQNAMGAGVEIPREVLQINDFADSEDSLNQLAELINTTSSRQLEIIGAAFAQLQQQLMQQSRNEESITTFDFNRLEAALVLVSDGVAGVSGTLQSQMIENFQKPVLQQLEEINTKLAQIQQRLEAEPQNVQSEIDLSEIQAALEKLSVPAQTSSPVDLSGIQAALGRLSADILNIPELIKNRQIMAEIPDLNPIREGIIKLRNQMLDLQESVDGFTEDSGSQSKKKPEEKIISKEVEEEVSEIFEVEETEEEIEQYSAQPIYAEPSHRGRAWRLTNILRGHKSAVTCLAINSAGKILASGSCKEIKLWNLETGTELHNFEIDSDAMAIADLAIHPDGELLAVANANIELWNLRTQEKTRTLETSFWASCVTISADGKIMVSAGEDPVDETGSIQIWKLPKAELLHDLGPDVIYAVAISPKGDILVTAGMLSSAEEEIEKEGLIQLRRLPSGEVFHTIKEPSKVYAVAISSDGNNLVTGGEDGKLKVWYLPTGQLLRKLEGHPSAVHSIAISPDGEIIATGSSDNTVKLWEMHTGALLQILDEHTEKVSKVAFSPDGKTLVSASSDMSVKVCRCG